MINILKSDFYKLKKGKAFWICIALCIAFAIFMVVAIQTGMNRAIANPTLDAENAQLIEMSKQASGVWALQYFLPMGFNIVFIGIFVAIFVSSEFTFGTMKNTLSRGADRIKVFFSKFTVCSCAALVMLIAFILAILASGTILWGFGTVTLSAMLNMVLLQALLIIAFTALFVFISMTMRSNGGAIATNIICVTMASTLLGALSMLFGGSIDLSQYWLSTSVSKLATLTPASGDVVSGIIIAICWAVGSILIGTILFKKQDVK